MVLFWILQFEQQAHFPSGSSGFTIPKHKDTQLEHFSDYSHLYFSLQILVWLTEMKLKRGGQKVSVTPEKVIWKLSKRKTFSKGFDNWKMLLKRYNSIWHAGRLCNFIRNDWHTCQPKYGFSYSSRFWISFSELDICGYCDFNYIIALVSAKRLPRCTSPPAPQHASYFVLKEYTK